MSTPLEPDGVAMTSTSVPRWLVTADEIDVDRTVTQWLVVATPQVTAESVDTVRRRLDPAPVVVVVVSDVAGPRLEGVLAQVRVGWRIVFLGGQSDLGSMRAAALRVGALPVEIYSISVDGATGFDTCLREVYCVHCHSVSRAQAGIGGLISCAGCARRLSISYHFSSLHHAYLGTEAVADTRRAQPVLTVAV